MPFALLPSLLLFWQYNPKDTAETIYQRQVEIDKQEDSLTLSD